jgi:hypothetical protein
MNAQSQSSAILGFAAALLCTFAWNFGGLLVLAMQEGAV